MSNEDTQVATKYKVMSPEAGELVELLMDARRSKRQVAVQVGVYEVPFDLDAPLTTLKLRVLGVDPDLHRWGVATKFTCSDEQQNKVTLVISHHMIKDSSVDMVLEREIAA